MAEASGSFLHFSLAYPSTGIPCSFLSSSQFPFSSWKREIKNFSHGTSFKTTVTVSLTAVAIAYEPGERAPKILATGKGYLADKIIEKAKEEDVPLYQDNQLANTLSRLEIGDMIPPELYEVVAEILVFVDDMDKLRSKLE